MPTHHLTADLTTPPPAIPDWTGRLSAVGLLDALPSPADTPPLSDIARLQQTHAELRRAAEKAEQTRTIELPDIVWWVVGGALLGIILFAEALVAALGPSAIWAGLALAVGTALFTLYDRNQRLADTHTRDLQTRLIRDIESVLARNFVLHLGKNILVSTPDLSALQLLADATEITDPGAEVTRRIKDQIDRTQVKIEELIRLPTPPGEQDLSVDLQSIQATLDALPPRPTAG